MLSLSKPLSRNEYLHVVRTGLLARQYSFSRQALLSWLATYPGDLEAGLYYAQSLIGERYYSQAIQVLLGLTYADPEYGEAVEVFFNLVNQIKSECQEPSSPIESILQSSSTCKDYLALIEPVEGIIQAHRFVLYGESRAGDACASWCQPVFSARKALAERNFIQAGELIKDLVAQEPAHPLISITHLRVLGNTDTPQDVRYKAAKNYHQRWPDNLEIMLRLADWSMERAESDQAVAFLHQSASRDVTGQVVCRLWGQDHPFKALWPEKLELKLNVMVPAVVAAILGWNRLTDGTALEVEPPGLPTTPGSAENHSPSGSGDHFPPEVTAAGQSNASEAKNGSLVREGFKPAPVEERLAVNNPTSGISQQKTADNEIRAVEREIEKLAEKYKISGLTRRDGRFPVYVILSHRGALQSFYGPEQAEEIEKEMGRLAESIRSRPGWDSKVCFADDLDWANSVGTKPVKINDPWGTKIALTDLDNSLARQGERIGALLIVGGSEIVPYHLLPNPVEDQDTEVPSDNPYGTRDRNYFVPEWPVGRLPGGAGSDPRLILVSLQRYQLEHRAGFRNGSMRERLFRWMDSGLKDLFSAERQSFGYTAEIWLEAARSVFRPIGKSSWLHVSPPSGLHQKDETISKENSILTGVPILDGKLGYFNLHGLVDSNEWYGHRDPACTHNCPDYPVALRPDQIPHPSGKGSIPRIVFSEACYGMDIRNRTIDEAISLKLLETGTLAMAGSTSMAYGSIDARPMMAADLLGHTFWRFLKAGMVAGEALRQAKIHLVSEMNRRQDYLDSEDQKTVISFILYGDPLAEPVSQERIPGSVRYSRKQFVNLKTVERPDEFYEAGPLPAEVMSGVREVVAKYLPGMSDAHIAYMRENSATNTSAPAMMTDTKGIGKRKYHGRGAEKLAKPDKSSFRNFITLSKQIARQGEIHPEIACLTLDEDGKLVKLVVSR